MTVQFFAHWQAPYEAMRETERGYRTQWEALNKAGVPVKERRVDVPMTEGHRIVGLRIIAKFETPAEALAFGASFPKSLRVKAWPTSTTATFEANLTEDGVNKGANETGIKRFRRALAILAERGTPATFCENPHFWNKYPSAEALFADLEAYERGEG